jgi:excisionase family DNA binding protein
MAYMDRDDELIGPGEAAKVLHVSPKTVTRWADLQLIPTAQVTLGGHRRFRRGSIENIAKGMGPPG